MIGHSRRDATARRGNIRVRLGMQDYAPCLTFYDSSGKERLKIGLWTDGSPLIQIERRDIMAPCLYANRRYVRVLEEDDFGFPDKVDTLAELSGVSWDGAGSAGHGGRGGSGTEPRPRGTPGGVR